MPERRATAAPPTAAGRPPAGARAVLRLVRRGRLPALRTAFWTARTVRLARRQLARRGLNDVRLPSPPAVAGRHRGVVVAALRRTGANCIERSLVLQRWYAGQRIARTVVIGVTAPSAGFHAHAWLEGDSDAEREAMVELLRRPAPPAWLTGAPAGRPG
ncbi:lasso peptide biosynthesis B2 protein [Micromonospora sp. NPDC000089]|uniref:lasso peptide biosynthesis B2 protein n=1 Tax=unclassified Micromonospora TaxID=2617518 RepID=UPI00367DAF2F